MKVLKKSKKFGVIFLVEIGKKLLQKNENHIKYSLLFYSENSYNVSSVN